MLKTFGGLFGVITSGIVEFLDSTFLFKAKGFREHVTETTTSRTVSNADNGKSIICTNASLTTVTLGDSLTTAANQTEFEIVADGAAGVSLEVSGSAQTNGATAALTIEQFKAVTVRKYATNEYRVYGTFT
jgi:hypothetical protein